MRAGGIELGLSGTDLFPRIVPWAGCGPSLGRPGWARDPGVSRPSSRLWCGQQGEVQRLALMARIFLCLANAATSVLVGTGPITVIVCLHPPAATVPPPSIDMRMSRSGHGTGSPLVDDDDGLSLCAPSSTYHAQWPSFLLGVVTLRVCLFSPFFA